MSVRWPFSDRLGAVTKFETHLMLSVEPQPTSNRGVLHVELPGFRFQVWGVFRISNLLAEGPSAAHPL